MVFPWSLSDSKSPQVSRTLLSILAVPNNAVVWMVSTCPPTSKTSSSFNNSLVIVQKAPIRIGIIVTFMFHCFFFNLVAMSSFILWSAVNHIIFTNPSARAGNETRSIYKRSLTGLNSEFSFS